MREQKIFLLIDPELAEMLRDLRIAVEHLQRERLAREIPPDFELDEFLDFMNDRVAAAVEAMENLGQVLAETLTPVLQEFVHLSDELRRELAAAYFRSVGLPEFLARGIAERAPSRFLPGIDFYYPELEDDDDNDPV